MAFGSRAAAPWLYGINVSGEIKQGFITERQPVKQSPCLFLTAAKWRFISHHRWVAFTHGNVASKLFNDSWKCTNELEEYNKKGVVNVPWCNTAKHQRASSLLRKKKNNNNTLAMPAGTCWKTTPCVLGSSVLLIALIDHFRMAS